MKQINFREINSKNYVNETLQGSSQPKTKKLRLLLHKFKNPLIRVHSIVLVIILRTRRNIELIKRLLMN